MATRILKKNSTSTSISAGPARAPTARRTPGRRPLYEAVVDTLRSEILAGMYTEKGVLPSESQLIERFEVSRITVRRALDELAYAGYVERRQGKVTRVIPSVPPAVISLSREMQSTIDLTRDMCIQVLDFVWKRPNAGVADVLQVPRQTRVLWVSRVRSRAGMPIVHTSVHMPADVGAKLSVAELESAQLVEVLAAKGHCVASAEQILSAAPCSTLLAPLLGLQAGDPVFCMRRVGYDAQKKPMFVLLSTFRWDCMNYRMSLREDHFPFETYAASDGGQLGRVRLT